MDLLTLSGHKFHGPKGVGALYVKKGIQLEPLIHCGKQEKGRRAGTENIAGIVGMGKAADLAALALQKFEFIAKNRDLLEMGIKKLIPEAQLNGHPTVRLPNTLNLTFPGIRGESLVLELDKRGICLSAGSACHSGSAAPSPTLIAMGLTEEQAHCSVRFSLGYQNTIEEINRVISTLKEIILESKKIIRFVSCR